MATRQEQFLRHKVHDALAQAESAIGTLEDEKHVQYRDDLARLQHVLVYCRETLGRVDMSIVQIPPVDSLQEHLTKLRNELEAFASDSNANHLPEANAAADNILNLLARLPMLPGKDYQEDTYRAHIAEYEREVNRLLRLLKERVNESDERLAQILSAMDKNEQVLSEKLNAKSHELEQLFLSKNNALNEELKKITDEIGAQKTRTDTIINEFQQQFNSAQESRLNEFSNYLKQVRDELGATIKSEKEISEKQIKDLKKDFDTLKESIDERADALILQMEEKKETASKLLEAVGITTLAGHYKNQADKEQKAANVLRGLAITLMLVMPGYVVFSAIQGIGDFTWESVAHHILFAAAFLVPALYIIHESAKHRKQEVRTRQLELELAAVHPYFDVIPDSDKKTEKRIELADRFFGHQQDEKLEAWQPPALQGLSGVIDALGNFAKKIK